MDDCQERPVDQASRCTEEDDQPHIDQEPLEADQFADDKDARKRNDRVGKEIGQKRASSHS